MNSNKPKVLFFTKHSKMGASSRYRTFQYLPYLDRAEIKYDVFPLFSEKYLINRYSKNTIGIFIHFFVSVVRRFVKFLKVKEYDLIIIEKEIFPYFPSIFESFLSLLKIKYIVDYDDALFHQYDRNKNWLIRNILKNKISDVMKKSTLVITGNHYLANYAKLSGAKNIDIIPTVIDLEKYNTRNSRDIIKKDSPFVIGWIGSPLTTYYLNLILPAIKKISCLFPVKLSLIGASNINLGDGINSELIVWNEETEVKNLHKFDVGIMPLPDEPWTRGKCGLKLIQYMACYLPVIASPVGINKELVDHKKNGFLASTEEEWINSFLYLYNHPLEREKMGLEGRAKVEQNYSLQISNKKYTQLIHSLLSED